MRLPAELLSPWWKMAEKIEQVHEDWKKGQYEYEMTKFAMEVARDINESMRWPQTRFIIKAVSSLRTYLSALIATSKNKKSVQGHQKKLNNLYLLLNRGIVQMNIEHEDSKYILKWEQVPGTHGAEDLRNKQVIPVIISDIFGEVMDLSHKLGYFIQKPFEKKNGVLGYMESGGIDLGEDDDRT